MFKNNILYDIRGIEGNLIGIPKISVAATASEDDIKTKIIEETRKVDAEYASRIVSVTKGVVPATTQLVANKVTGGENYNTVVEALGNNVNKFVLYDISLVNENVKIQPNGNVRISLPIPDGFDTSKIAVYIPTKNYESNPSINPPCST